MQKEIVRRLRDWKQSKPRGPYEIEIWPSGARCNLNCVYCEPEGDPNKEISETRLEKFVGEAIELGAQKFYISGGEPFLRKGLVINLMKKIKKNDCVGIIITNGTLLDKYSLDKMVEMGWDEVVFSLDAPIAELNDFFRGEGVFKKVIENLKYLDKIRDDVPPTITVNTVLTKENYNLLREMVEMLGADLNCETLLLQPLMPVTQECESFKMDNVDQVRFMEILEEAITITEKYDINTNLRDFNSEEYIDSTDNVPSLLKKSIEEGAENFSRIPCFQPWYKISIDGEGRIAPCGSLQKTTKLSIKSDELESIWYDDFQNIRNEIKSVGMPDACENCCIQQIFENEDIREKLKKCR